MKRICREVAGFAVAAKELGHEDPPLSRYYRCDGSACEFDMMWKIFQMKLLKRHVRGVAEPPVDILYKETFNMSDADHSFR